MGDDMSKASFSVAYDGDGRRDDHTMSVELLAPALLGFGKLIREVNAEINGKRATADVRVISDFEHKCFQINFETVVTYYEMIRALLEQPQAQSAKNILEWAGLIVGTPVSLLAYLKFRHGKRVDKERRITDESGEGFVEVPFGDQTQITVNTHIYNLGESPRALNAVKEAMAPIGQDGFSRVETREDGTPSEIFTEEDARAIIASCQVALTGEDEPQPEPEVTTAWLSVYGPVYDEKADKWRFRLGTEIVYVDISETTIAKDALARGGAMASDSYQVRLEVAYQSDDKKGKPTYKIVEVLNFVPAPPRMQQGDIFSQ